ncbi:MAG: hypothetical protein QM749_00090 [Aquabacterium sp.]
MTEDLTFSLMIKTSETESSLINLLTKNLEGAQRVGGYIKYSANVINLERNSLYDEAKASRHEGDSWLYYPYNLNIFPTGEVTKEGQIDLANKLQDMLRAAGASVEVISEIMP